MIVETNMYNEIITECDLKLKRIGHLDEELFLIKLNKNGKSYAILNDRIDVDEVMNCDVVHVETIERYLDLLDDACVMIKQDLNGNPFMEIDEKLEAEMRASLNRKMHILSRLYVWYREIHKLRDFKLNHMEIYLNEEACNKYELKYSKEDLMEFSYEDLIGYKRRLEFELTTLKKYRDGLTDFILTIINTDDISEELYDLCRTNNKIKEVFELLKKVSNIMQKKLNKNNQYNESRYTITCDDDFDDCDIPF